MLNQILRLIILPITFLQLSCVNNDSCEQMNAQFRELIATELNFCEIDQDCKVVRGVCPLGCFFIVHEESIKEIERMVGEVMKKCPRCVYKCAITPEKLKCIDKVCYPAVEESYTAILFHNECEVIAAKYSKDLIGKKATDLDLHILDYEIIQSDSLPALIKRKDHRFNNLKLFVDEEGIIESVYCFSR